MRRLPRSGDDFQSCESKSTMNLGDATTSAFTLFEEMGEDVTYLGGDFLKCCGHDQKWQGMTGFLRSLRHIIKRN